MVKIYDFNIIERDFKNLIKFILDTPFQMENSDLVDRLNLNLAGILSNFKTTLGEYSRINLTFINDLSPSMMEIIPACLIFENLLIEIVKGNVANFNFVKLTGGDMEISLIKESLFYTTNDYNKAQKYLTTNIDTSIDFTPTTSYGMEELFDNLINQNNYINDNYIIILSDFIFNEKDNTGIWEHPIYDSMENTNSGISFYYWLDKILNTYPRTKISIINFLNNETLLPIEPSMTQLRNNIDDIEYEIFNTLRYKLFVTKNRIGYKNGAIERGIIEEDFERYNVLLFKLKLSQIILQNWDNITILRKSDFSMVKSMILFLNKLIIKSNLPIENKNIDNFRLIIDEDDQQIV